MNSAVIPFQYQSHAIRTVTIDGEPWFVGKDVAEALGYKNASNAMTDHCKGVAKRYPLQTAGGVQEIRVIHEADVLRLIVSSTLPEAQAFEHWVFEEVLPSIRKTGRYAVSNLSLAKAVWKGQQEAMRQDISDQLDLFELYGDFERDQVNKGLAKLKKHGLVSATYTRGESLQ